MIALLLGAGAAGLAIRPLAVMVAGLAAFLLDHLM